MIGTKRISLCIVVRKLIYWAGPMVHFLGLPKLSFSSSRVRGRVPRVYRESNKAYCL
jgi:hypothetical protein